MTNKRVGVVSVTVNKTWVDGKNQKSSRPSSLNFTLTAYEDGSLKTIKFPDSKNILNWTDSEKSDVTISLSPSDEDVSDSNHWTCTINNLPKYDSEMAS